jgi:microcystin-dependent protein
MSEPFIGEIRLIGFNFAPVGWAFCDGQLLAISQNDALFSLIGTTYGGDGNTTFALPDLRGRVPLHAGSGPGLPPYPLAAKGGSESGSLSLVAVTNPVSHSHPHRRAEGAGASGRVASYTARTPVAQSAPFQTLDNMQPWLGVNFVIALFGIYPSSS